MCGRFTLRTPQHVLVEHFALAARGQLALPLFAPRYNIAPTQEIAVIRPNSVGGREVAMMRWGLIPSWSKELASGPPLINARAESLAEKPSFRAALRRRRCLIPADGFYEWKKSDAAPRGKKQPYYIHRPDFAPFAFAGLWETWQGEETSGRRLTIDSCTIVTTTANEKLRELHDRMPVILGRNDYQVWLDPRTEDPKELEYLLTPTPSDELVLDSVSTYVNRVANDDARCIAIERSLFD